MTNTNDILAVVFPVALTVLLGLVGLFRGVRREAVLSAAIVLGALIVQQWGIHWGQDVSAMFTNFSPEWTQLVLSYALVLLVVLVLGYGLGRFLVAVPLTASSRIWGLLLGLMNGAALGGWLLRYIYSILDGEQASSPLYKNGISYGFMFWAGWFPLVLAALGALVALFAPLRRVQASVSQPAHATDWTPAPAIVPAAVPPRVDPLAPTMPHPYTPQPAPNAAASTAAPAVPNVPNAYNPFNRPSATPERDAPSTRLFPVSEVAPPTREVSDSDLQSNATRSFATTAADWSRPAPKSPDDVAEAPLPAEWQPSLSEPSWLMTSTSTSSSVPAVADSGQGIVDETVVTTVAQPVSVAEGNEAARACANCGKPLLPNARFCTDCGTPVEGQG